MIQGINSDYDSYFSATSVTANSITKTTDSDTEKKAESTQTAKTDTVEISAQARAAMQQANSIVSVGGKTSADSSENQLNSTNGVQSLAAKASAPATGASAGKSSSTSSTDISGLSEAEMDKLVSAGTITKSEELQELAKRAAEKTDEETVKNLETQLTQSPMDIL